jgi:superfamily I DNA/RNA helicase
LFREDVLETWPALEAFMLLEIAGDADPIALRAWVGYQKPTNGKDFKAAQRNASAYLALQQDYGLLTLDLVAELDGKPPNEFRGSGKSRLLYRLERLRELLTDVPSDEPGEAVAHIFDPDRWVDFEGDHAELAREDILRLRAESEALLEAMDEPSIKKLVDQLRHRIATREPLGAAGEDGGVRIVTLWGAKGLTADYVYVAGLVDEALPGPHDPDSTALTPAQHLAEQRRLLYVSLTRAKKALVISRSKKIKWGDAPGLGLSSGTGGGYWQTLHRTRFFDALPSGVLPTAIDGTNWDGIDVDED